MMRRFLALSLLVLLAPAAAHAAGGFQTWGPHIGFSSTPSDVVVGGHLEMGNIAPQVDFVPSVDVGLGNDTFMSVCGDFRYRIQVPNATWQPYAGAGVALHLFSSGSSQSNKTEGGGELLVGADVPTKTGNRFFVEGKFGIGDGPSFKALAGWCFPMR